MRRFTGRTLRSAATAVRRVQEVLRPDAVLLAALDEALRARPDATVVLVSCPRNAGPVRSHLAAAGVAVHEVDPTGDDLDVRLAVLGGVDVLVLDDPGAPDGAALVERLVHHLAGNGVLLVRNVGDGGDGEDGVAAVLDRWAESGTVVDPAVARTVKRRKRRKRGGLARVTVQRLGRHAEVTLRTGHFLKLREEQADQYLRLAGRPAGQVLETREAVRWTSRARVRQAGDPPKELPEEYDVPAMALREYRDVRCYPGQVALHGSVILPDSFRHNQRKTLGNQRLRPVSEPFASPDQLRDTCSPLAGDFFYLDSSYRGHFGHAMTEQLSRLWAWPRAKELFPELKVLLLEEKRTQLYSFETELYGAAGVAAEDLVLVPGPVAVDRLVAATPMFSQPQYVHPDLEEVYRRVSDALVARAPGGDLPTRFFCSRRHDKRACHNTEEVERLFVDHGFTVVYPEDYPLAVQARLFRGAEVVAGFAGSAMFNLLFATDPTKVIMVAPGNYWAQNEYMIASVLGHDLTVAWSEPDVPRVPGAGFDPRTFHSPYTFDRDREGRLVLEVLGELGDHQ